MPTGYFSECLFEIIDVVDDLHNLYRAYEVGKKIIIEGCPY